MVGVALYLGSNALRFLSLVAVSASHHLGGIREHRQPAKARADCACARVRRHGSPFAIPFSVRPVTSIHKATRPSPQLS